MNIKDKLRIYDSGKVTSEEGNPRPLESLGAVPVETADRVIWKFTGTYPVHTLFPSFDHNDTRLLRPFVKFNKTGQTPAMSELLFFDLETTSLSTGSGSYPFLTGLGYFKGDDFIIDQYFMDDYPAEGPILRHIIPYFSSARAVVCFNGMSFDMPLIKNRYRMNRVPSFPMDIPVIDLLYPCRRVFRRIYESCSLVILEEKVLGMCRKDDIPGWLIPEVYFSYQKHGETGRLPLVVRHNAQDILSMYQLMMVLNRIYDNLEKREFSQLDRQSLLGMANQLFRVDRGIFIDVMEFIGEEIMEIRPLFKKYSASQKKAGKLAEALSLWEKHHTVLSLEELAKHYEHREKDLPRAAGYARSALTLVSRGLFSFKGRPLTQGERELYERRFSHRLQRLNRKIG